MVKGKGKALPIQAWTGPWGSRRFRLPEFLCNRHMQVVRLTSLRTGHLYPKEIFLSRPRGHSASWRLMPIKKKASTNRASAGSSSGEYEWCSTVVTFFFDKKSLTKTDRCAGALSFKEKPTVGFLFFGAFPSDCVPKATKEGSAHLFIHSNSCKLHQRIPGNSWSYQVDNELFITVVYLNKTLLAVIKCQLTSLIKRLMLQTYTLD